MADVYVKTAEYNYKTLKATLYPLLEVLDRGRIERKQKVLVKPNLLSAASADRAITTHPLVVRIVVEYLKDRGAEVIISDSPAMGGFRKILRQGGYLDALRGLDVRFQEFKGSTKVELGEPFTDVELAEDIFRVDHVINLPKLKTHSQMLLTLSIKNLFGTVVGLRKPQWHLRIGTDRIKFAELLYRIAMKVNPLFTVMDAILALEGDGPGKAGSPRRLGIILASTDPVAIDITVCKAIGIEPETLPTNRVAIQHGYRPDSIRLQGELPRIKRFRLPDTGPLIFGPQILHPFMRRNLVERPVVDESRCIQCGQCWSYCPADAIHKARKAVVFDYNRCIRCYCCVEVCPEGAITKKQPLAGKVLKRFIR